MSTKRDAKGLSEETRSALEISDRAREVVIALDPLSARGKGRVLAFFLDLAQDPDAKCDVKVLDVLREVERILKRSWPR